MQQENNDHRQKIAKAMRSRQKPGRTSGKNQRLFVDHSYIDHKDDQPSTPELHSLAKLKEHDFSSRRVPFPLKLHRFLKMAVSNDKMDIISWQPHGRCFRIHDKKRFEAEVLIPILKMKSMALFIKQLSLYGFRRLTRGSGCDAGSYYHEIFLSGREFLAYRMKRDTNKGMGYRAAARPDKEPDFYRMPSCSVRARPAISCDPLGVFDSIDVSPVTIASMAEAPFYDDLAEVPLPIVENSEKLWDNLIHCELADRILFGEIFQNASFLPAADWTDEDNSTTEFCI